MTNILSQIYSNSTHVFGFFILHIIVPRSIIAKPLFKWKVTQRVILAKFIFWKESDIEYGHMYKVVMIDRMSYSLMNSCVVACMCSFETYYILILAFCDGILRPCFHIFQKNINFSWLLTRVQIKEQNISYKLVSYWSF